MPAGSKGALKIVFRTSLFDPALLEQVGNEGRSRGYRYCARLYPSARSEMLHELAFAVGRQMRLGQSHFVAFAFSSALCVGTGLMASNPLFGQIKVDLIRWTLSPLCDCRRKRTARFSTVGRFPHRREMKEAANRGGRFLLTETGVPRILEAPPTGTDGSGLGDRSVCVKATSRPRDEIDLAQKGRSGLNRTRRQSTSHRAGRCAGNAHAVCLEDHAEAIRDAYGARNFERR